MRGKYDRDRCCKWKISGIAFKAYGIYSGGKDAVPETVYRAYESGRENDRRFGK